MISDNGDITNYVKKDNLEQAKYLLENVFNEIENKPPNMLPKIFGMPYDAHFLENFKVLNQVEIIDNATCKVKDLLKKCHYYTCVLI